MIRDGSKTQKAAERPSSQRGVLLIQGQMGTWQLPLHIAGFNKNQDKTTSDLRLSAFLFS
jgi:hypothetical protein